MKRSLYLCLILLIPFTASAQVSLLKDINNGLATSSSLPNNLTTLNGSVYYSASDALAGTELWKSDGTTAGTTRVKDIYPGENGSSPANFELVGSFIYFAANDGVNGSELWRTDGTEAGTIMVKDINPGISSSGPTNITAIGTTAVYFSATETTTGLEPYKSDVATKATTLLLDIVSGTTGSSSQRFTYASGTTMYFVATDGNGSELWKTDGTSTVRLSNFTVGITANLNMCMFNNSVYFSADDGTSGNEVWSSNGSAPTMLKNINTTASTGSNPFLFTVAGSFLYFGANDGTTGSEVWRSDGTSANTVNISNFPVGGVFSNIDWVAVGSSLYFYANTSGSTNAELFRMTSAGVATMIDINPGLNSSGPGSLANINGSLFLTATTATTGAEMVIVPSGGTAFSVVDIFSGTNGSTPTFYTALNSTTVLFRANNGSGTELWKWDSTQPTQATQIIDLVTGSEGSAPVNFFYNGSNATFFQASDGSGNDLWKTDGVDGTPAHTFRIKDINTTANNASNSYPGNFVMVGSTVYFAAYDGTDSELFRTDGTLNNAVKIDLTAGTLSTEIYEMVVRGNELIISGYNDVVGHELFRYNTVTSAITAFDLVPGDDGEGNLYGSEPYNLTVMGSSVFFTAHTDAAGNELFEYNGTTPFVAANIAPSNASSDPGGYAVIDNVLYFSAGTAASGSELYKYPVGGPAALVKDINPSGHSSPGGFFKFGSFIYFTAFDPTNGEELWRTDGTTAGTKLFKNINPNASSSSPGNFVIFQGKMYFDARTAANGIEMWVTDGAADANGLSTSTELFKDFNIGAASGGFYSQQVVGTKMFMIGNELNGPRVYVTDGRSCATLPVTPFAGGQTASAQSLTQAPGGKLVFSMTLANSGRELFVLDPALITLPVDALITAHPAPTQTVTMPAQASFAVTATGTGLTYQWQKNTVNIGGATLSTYSIPATTDTDAGTYRVVVTGTCGSATSNNSVLTVNVVTPTAQPSTLVFSGQTTTSVAGSFTASSPASSSYLVLRKKGSAPTDVPVDGVVYAASSILGTSLVVKSNAATTFSDTGLDDASEYFYAVFSYNGAGSLTKYLTTLPLTGSSFTLAAEPFAQPTVLNFSNVDGTSLTGSFSASATASRYLVIRKAGAAPTAVPTDGTVYSTNDVLGDAIVAYLGDTPSFNDAGLSSETTYHYKVFAGRGPASTINYLTSSPLSGTVITLTAAPEVPTLFKFSNVTPTGFTVSFTPPANAPAGYLVLRNQGTTLTAVPADGIAYVAGQTVGDGRVAYIGPNPTFDENLPLLAYSYAVFPYNGGGASINYTTANPLTGFIAPDDTAPIITDQTVASIGAGSPVTISAGIAEPQSGIQEVTVEYKSVAKAGATTTRPMVLNINKYELVVPAVEIGELGVEYTISAINSLGLKSTKTSKTILTYTDQSITVGPAGDDVSNYRIISVPLDLSAKTVKDVFVDNLGSYDGKAWRMYRFDNGTTNELTESSLIEPGKGYWLIIRNPGKTVDTGAGSTVAVSTAAPFVIEMKQGWNQIGNPYNFNILWGDVTAASNINIPLKTYVGGWATGDRLAKSQGGFVFANAPGTLKFPTQYNGAAGRIMDEPKRLTNSIDQNNWEVNFTLRIGGATNTFGGLGMNKSANELYDEFDDITVPRFVGYVELNHNKKVHNSRMTKDVIPTKLNHTWDFTIETSAAGATDLVWDNSYFGVNDLSLVLWDEEESLAIDMKEVNSYAFFASGSRKFKVFFGDKEYVTEKSSANHVRIHTLSPNPAEGAVNLTFTIPGTGQSTVDVKVFNTLGQPVSSVFNGILGGGVHSMSWVGTDLNGVRPSPGVYLIEVVSNGQRIAKRVVLR